MTIQMIKDEIKQQFNLTLDSKQAEAIMYRRWELAGGYRERLYWCDICDRQRYYKDDAEAKVYGWTFEKGNSYCPACS